MIRVLRPCQFRDGHRQFYVGVRQSRGKRHKGLPVYEDAYGVKFVIVGAE